MEKLTNGISVLLDSIFSAIPRIAISLVLLFVGLYIVRLLLSIIARRFEKREVEISLRGFLLSIIRAVLYILLLITVASTMGIQTTIFTAMFASAGLAIGLALQGSLSNFAGGVLILLFKPFKVGEYIGASSGPEGTVEKIDLLYTTLTTSTGLKVVSPNGPLANAVVTNYSEITRRRYDFIVGISYDSNIKDAQEIIKAALDKDASVLKDPAPIIFVTNLADSSVELNIRIWMSKEDYWNTVYRVQQDVKVALDKGNINIPFPQRELHILSDQTK
ncbi:mechanosensitive ion channel family protein [Myroides sp. LJL116]